LATDAGVLQSLESDPNDPPVGAPPKNVVDVSKPAVEDPVKGDGTVVSTNSTAVSLNVTSGPLAGQTIVAAVTSKTAIAKSGQPCTLGTADVGAPAFFVISGSGTATPSLDALELG
jgi:hypothetical protein